MFQPTQKPLREVALSHGIEALLSKLHEEEAFAAILEDVEPYCQITQDGVETTRLARVTLKQRFQKILLLVKTDYSQYTRHCKRFKNLFLKSHKLRSTTACCSSIVAIRSNPKKTQEAQPHVKQTVMTVDETFCNISEDEFSIISRMRITHSQTALVLNVNTAHTLIDRQITSDIFYIK